MVVKNLNGTIFVRFVYDSYKVLHFGESDESIESDDNENSAHGKSSHMETSLPHSLPAKQVKLTGAKPKKMKL